MTPSRSTTRWLLTISKPPAHAAGNLQTTFFLTSPMNAALVRRRTVDASPGWPPLARFFGGWARREPLVRLEVIAVRGRSLRGRW
jgi:hypothetical protein